MNSVAVITIAVLATSLCREASSQDSFKCPHEYGFYPHHRSCDKYWKCENNQASLKTCGNGLAFDPTDPKFLTENCDYLHTVDCGDRTELEPPQSSANCPRLYGIFADEEKCDVFWSCWNGEANKYTCAPGLAYDADARVCMWADQVPGCKLGDTKDGGFTCPNQKDNPNSGAGTFSRHAHPEDCRKYYVCLDGNPREYGCPIGTVFKIGGDDFSGQCEDPEGVDGCENYYGDELKGVKKSALLNGGGDYYERANKKPAVSQNRKKVPQQPKKVVVPEVVVQQQQQPVRVSHRQQQQQHHQQQQQPQQQVVQQQTRFQQRQQQHQQRPTTQQPPTTTTTTSKPVTTTSSKALADDEYYYYDENYDTQPQQQQQQQQKKQ